MISFSRLGLSGAIAETVATRDYDKPTEIQNRLIPAILSGSDILASAETGTGKTAGFVLPVLQEMLDSRMSKEAKGRQGDQHHILQTLILAPTRELAKQLAGHIEAYSSDLPFRCLAVYGGRDIGVQARQISKGADILVGTPGRILEHLRRKNLDLGRVEYFVMDEADTILDMGFIKEVSQIIQSLKTKRQNIIVSATLPASLRGLSAELLHRPREIELAVTGTVSKAIRQVLHPVEKAKKLELLSFLIGSRNYRQVLVFVRKKAEADQVAAELSRSGLKTAVIHGDRTSGARSRALGDFREKKIRVLVATDIAARGLDIKDLDVVINYDIPHVKQDYIHRIGRTGRAGREGLAIILSSPEESIDLKALERMLGRTIASETIPGYEPPRQKERKGARKKPVEKRGRTAGAFGKRKSQTTTKKRKTSKRDRFK